MGAQLYWAKWTRLLKDDSCLLGQLPHLLICLSFSDPYKSRLAAFQLTLCGSFRSVIGWSHTPY